VSSISPSQADQLSVCGAARPFLSSYTKNQFRRLVPRVEIPLQCRERVRVTALPTPTFVASGGTLDAHPAMWGTPASFGDVTLRRIGSHVDVSGDIKDNVSLVQPVLEWQVQLAEAAIDNVIWSEWLSTTPSADAGPSLSQLASANPNGVIDAAEAPLSLDLLGRLRRLISWWDFDSPLVYVMHSRVFEALESAARTAQTPILYLPSGPSGSLRPQIGAFPVALADHISLQETTVPDTTSVYLVRLGRGEAEPVGIEGLSVLVPAGAAGLQRSPPKPISGNEDVWRVTVWKECALSVESEDSVARMNRVLTPT
jgi:hypothetical protein